MSCVLDGYDADGQVFEELPNNNTAPPHKTLVAESKLYELDEELQCYLHNSAFFDHHDFRHMKR